MKKASRPIQAFVLLAFLLGLPIWAGGEVAAQSSSRQTTIVVSYKEYTWWMISWETNQVLCQVIIDHEGLPEPNEVLKDCGWELYLIWLNTPPCTRTISDCEGVYLHLTSIRQKERQMIIKLPPATVWVDVDGCELSTESNFCSEIPDLVLTGEEPLPEERITAIRGLYAGQPFVCYSDVCKLKLRPTPVQGVIVEFWAESSFGDTSERFTAQVRVVDTGVSVVPGGGGWYVDVISSQWIGPPVATCVQIWESFPPVGEPPTWLATPDSNLILASEEPYYYLAGRLISQGLVDASTCVTGGLLTNGYADACGLDKARPLLAEWQNQFDQRIIDVAKETGVPAQLIKNLFAQESQFWPNVFRVPYEFGLGQITGHGADSILLYNDSFYEQFCPLILSQETCDKGYLHISEEESAILRGAVALQAKTDCAECPQGVDLGDANFSVDLFANTLIANCAQVAQTIYNASGLTGGQISSYEDLWRMTVANYHAGPGCVAFAIHQTWQATGILTWEEVSTRFTVPCQGVVPYVNKISR